MTRADPRHPSIAVENALAHLGYGPAVIFWEGE